MDFIPFHRLGESKYRMLGRDYLYAGVQPVENLPLENISNMQLEKGFTVTTGG
jgi:hypothetical protein